MDNIQDLLQSHIHSFGKTQQKVAVFLLENSARIREYELNDIADATGVSRSSILRFIKDIGFSGYRELKQFIVSTDTQQGNDPLVDWVIGSTDHVVRQTIATLDHRDLNHAIDRCATASRLFWYGVGESGVLAELANYRCWLMGIESSFCREMSLFGDISYQIKPSEVLIVISRRGDGDYLYETLEGIKERSIFTIGVTSNRLSWLAQNASVSLFPLSQGASIGSRHVPIRAGYELVHNALILGTARKRGIQFTLDDDSALAGGGDLPSKKSS